MEPKINPKILQIPQNPVTQARKIPNPTKIVLSYFIRRHRQKPDEFEVITLFCLHYSNQNKKNQNFRFDMIGDDKKEKKQFTMQKYNN